MKRNLYEKTAEYTIVRYEDGWWITWWSGRQQRRIKSRGPYKYKQMAKIDLEILEITEPQQDSRT